MVAAPHGVVPAAPYGASPESSVPDRRCGATNGSERRRAQRSDQRERSAGRSDQRERGTRPPESGPLRRIAEAARVTPSPLLSCAALLRATHNPSRGASQGHPRDSRWCARNPPRGASWESWSTSWPSSRPAAPGAAPRVDVEGSAAPCLSVPPRALTSPDRPARAVDVGAGVGPRALPSLPHSATPARATLTSGSTPQRAAPVEAVAGVPLCPRGRHRRALRTRCALTPRRCGATLAADQSAAGAPLPSRCSWQGSRGRSVRLRRSPRRTRT